MGLPGMGVASGGVAGRAYLSLPGARVGSAMALRRVFLLRSAAPRAQPAASPGAVRAWGAAEAVRRPVPVVDFSNTQEAYRSRRSWELVRNLLVLRLCASRVLLVHHEQVRAGGGGGGQVGRGRAGHRRGQRVTEFGSVRQSHSGMA